MDDRRTQRILFPDIERMAWSGRKPPVRFRGYRAVIRSQARAFSVSTKVQPKA